MASLLCLLALAFAMPASAQEEDDLQAYLDQLAEQQVNAPQDQQGRRKAKGVDIPVGLTEVDLSAFTATQRKKSLTVSSSCKFVNGTLTASSSFSGGGCLVNIKNGATVVMDSSVKFDASNTTSSQCFATVGIYDCGYNTTFYQQGDIIAPNNGTGYGFYIECQSGTLYYRSTKLQGNIYNPNKGTAIDMDDPDPEHPTQAELLQKLSDIGSDINTALAIWNNANDIYTQLADRLPASDYAKVVAKMNELKSSIDAFNNRKSSLTNQVNNTSAHAQLVQLENQIDQLGSDVQAFLDNITIQIATLDEQVKGWAYNDLGNRLSTAGNTLTGMGNTLSSYSSTVGTMLHSGSGYYFEKQITTAFNNQGVSTLADITTKNNQLNSLISQYNNLVNSSISSVQGAINFYQKLESLQNSINSLYQEITALQQDMNTLTAQYEALDVNFPDETENYSVRPSGLSAERQLGYKSNRGYVMTSGGIAMFEQKAGADFYFIDQEGNYIMAKPGISTLFPAEDKAQATVWTGQSLGNGSYTFYSKTASRYLAFTAGTNVNAPITASTSAYAWKIVEPGLDDLQAFMNILAEEDEAPQDDMPTDTLVIRPPVYCYGCSYPRPVDPYIFPRVPYVIHVVGDDQGELPIPRPSTGTPGTGYNPIWIPKGSHVVIDNITIRDIIGGHHVIYVDGILEINVTVNIYIQNWTYFIQVGPNGHVIWRNPGDGSRPVLNEGQFDMTDGQLDKIDNKGTVNHIGGTIIDIINRMTYYFKGGMAYHTLNYGTFNHSNGTVRTARNYSGGTYVMTGGEIYNTVNNSDTVFVNRGTFRFTGGIIRGYGSRLIYHGLGAYMRIDGGIFDFTHITHYFIEAHSDFYIRGNYNYNSPLPILLAPKVVIRLLYKWIYNFNIVFIGGRPTPRYPLFWGEGFTLTRNHFIYIDWTLPNSRWRWHVNEDNNTIEPRDEEVEDEDDLQAYLDWLAEHKDDDAASSESQPQELDLGGRTISITKPVELPTGSHVVIKNGTFVPKGTWAYDKVFYIPTGCSLRLDAVNVNFSSQSIYHVGGSYVQRNIFHVLGTLYFGPGTLVKGYHYLSIKPTDNFIPGAVCYMTSTSKVIIDGAVFYNIVFRTSNVVNIYLKSKLREIIEIYVPMAYRHNGFRVIAPYGGYSITKHDTNYIDVVKSGEAPNDTPQLGVEKDNEGYGALTDNILMGDVNGDGEVSVTDVSMLVAHILGNTPENFRIAAADVTGEGEISVADVNGIVSMILQK